MKFTKREIGFIVAIIVGLIIGKLIKKVTVGILIGLFLVFVAAVLVSSRKKNDN